jgi:uncharacterized protein (UPF0264 family)
MVNWPARWRKAIACWPTHVRPVAVIYADWRRANAPPPDAILAEAIAIGCPAVLLDTWSKTTGALFDLWSVKDVARLCAQVRKAGIAAVLAGSLDNTGVETAVKCGANLVAVRGAACVGGRTGTVCVDRVRAISDSVSSLSPMRQCCAASQSGGRM